MATKIKHKRSAVAGKQPSVSQLESGELAINTADGKVYLLRDDNTVQDITKRVFEGNTELKVDDLGDSTSAAITARVNADDKMIITDNGININDDVQIENANTLTLKELTGSGADGVSLKAPDTLDAGYSLTLPPNSGTIGQLLKTDANGNLSFTDPDIFGGNVVYVSNEQGDDINDGQSAPVKTIKRACQIASGLVYNTDGTTNNKRVNVKVAVGDYTEQNPIIVPDNTVIKGDGLRGCILRPANANEDMLRVRNACYFGEVTFRDGVDENGVPLITFDYAVAFDDPFDVTVARVGYTNMPTSRPFITTSPYIQNCSILSFLGGNGAKIDGSKITSPNVGLVPSEQENPVVGSIPEQGKSMVANAFTILSFGGTAWRLTNDAYAQIVSCFEIFLLNGVYTQSGGYCSITNSATNFGLYALRSSGYSPKAFEFDRAFVSSTGAFEGLQTLSVVGINRASPVEEFVLRFRDPDYKTARDLLLLAKNTIATDTVSYINTQIAGASASIWAGYDYDPLQAKCERDTKLLVDAIRYDAAFNTNYRSIASVITYFNGRQTPAVFESQRLQEVDAFTQAKAFTTNITQDSTYDARVNALWDEVIDILEHSGTYTAGTGTSYNAASGSLILNVGAHDLTVGTQIEIAPNSLSFSCDYGQGAHTYVGGTVTDAITITSGSVKRDVTDATYNHATGVMELTIGSHSFTTSDTVTIETNSLTFTCAADSNATNHTYPRVGDPADGVAIAISAVSGTTITVNVGAVGSSSSTKTYPRAVNASNGDPDPAYKTPVTITAVNATTVTVNIGNAGSAASSAHTFESATANSITVAGTGTFSDPTGYNTSYLAGYGNARAQLIANRKFIVAEITAYVNNQIAAGTAPFSKTFTYSKEKCEEDIGHYLDAFLYDLTYGGNLQTIDAANQNFTNTTQAGGLANNRLSEYGEKAQTLAAYVRLKEVLGQIVQEQTVTKSGGGVHTYVGGTVTNAVTITAPNQSTVQRDVTNATYDPDTGLSVITIGSHSFTTSDKATIVTNSLSFTCDTDGNTVTKTYPRSTDPAAGTALSIASVTGNTITVNIGKSGNTVTQDVSGTAGGSDTAVFVQARMQEVIDFITADGATQPTKIDPGVSWVAQAYQDDLIRLNAEGQKNIAQNVSGYIETQTEAAKWYNFVYDSAKCLRDTKLIVEAVAKDTWDTGNRYSRSAGLSYYTKNLADSSQISISGQERQTIDAIKKARDLALTYITSVSAGTQNFVSSRFDIVTTIINDPGDLPDAQDVSSEGDTTNNFKTNATEKSFNAATDVNIGVDVITITGHGFANLQKVIYTANGNTPLGGLDEEQTYYINIINDDEFKLTFDESGDFPVDIRVLSTGSHKFLSGVIEFFVQEITSSHTTYQQLELESGSESFVFTPGKSIAGTTGSSNNSAIVSSWEPAERRLIVSVEQVAVGSSLLRIQFDATSVITADHAGTPNASIGVNAVQAKTGLGSATFSVKATDGSSSLTNLGNLPESQVWFHRPSIVNSSSHTWEYAGSGTDYNALPQNGGNTKAEFEQFEELPGRVYSSGTNELGDFKVGDFITAFNRTGNITFRNKVQVDELDALRLSVSDVIIEEISTSVNLGDDELGGATNTRLSTQLAVRSFISNRLGGFVDKTVSTAAVPGAIVQLNVNGQLNADLIPATRQFTNTNTFGYLSRLDQIDDIPAVDLKAGDIGTENYEQQELTLSGNISAADGATITQPTSFGATGYAKGLYGNSGNILVASITGEWIAGDDSTGSQWATGAGNNLFVDGVDSGVYPTALGVVSEIVDNFFIKTSNSSQFLVLDPTPNYTFTTNAIANAARTSNVSTITTSGAHNLQIGNTVNVTIADNSTFDENAVVISTPTATSFTYANVDPDNVGSFSVTSGTVGTVVKSADGDAQGKVTETRFGVATGVDNAAITGGSLYTPTTGSKIYKNIPMTAVTGSGTGARANITVTAGQITDVDLIRGGTGYASGDELGASPTDIGGTGSGFKIVCTAIEKRIYVDIIGGVLFVASTSSVDFVEDNTAIANKKTINLDDNISKNFLAGSSGGSGNVDYTNDRITITNHGFTTGDPVSYDTLTNVPIGGLTNTQVVYVKVIDANTIELYEGFSLLNKVEFLTTPANNNHNLTRKTVNITDNSIIVEGHGFTTGNALRLVTLSDGSSSNALFSVGGTAIASGSRFFVGSVTTNSFTLHTLRSDALSSINDLVTNAQDIDGIGVGSAEVIQQNVQVISQVNSSSKTVSNWNSLAVTNIDASNIISGIVSPSRLGGAGTPNSDTFLRGDSAYSVVVQKLKKASTTDNPITLTGSSISQEFYGTVNVGVNNIDLNPGGTFSTLGTSRFLQSQFDVASDASGQVFLKDGVIDAGTLDSLDSAYFLNPANLTSAVPVNRGGTNLTTYAVGDIIYASTTGTLNPLNIGRKDSVLKVSATGIPEWGTALDLAEGLDVGAAKLTSSSTGAGQVYNANVSSLEIGGAATNIAFGSTADTRNIFTLLASYEANASQSVVANLTSITQTTNGVAANGDKEIPLTSTTGILSGMLITGSASIPANTTVTGVTENFIYLSAETTGTVASALTLTFTYTPFTLGINVGDTINVASSTIANLDGSWPVTGATENATSFTFQTDANVTASNGDTPAGALTIDSNFVVKNTKFVLGNAEHATTPEPGRLLGTSGIGTDKSGGSISIEGGLGTGNGTGGDVIIKTGDVSTTGDIKHTSKQRMKIDTQGHVGIGEHEPDTTLHIKETAGTDTTFTMQRGANTDRNQIVFEQADGTAVGHIKHDAGGNDIVIGNYNGSAIIDRIKITGTNGNVEITSDLEVDGGDITTDQATFNLINTNATSVNAFGAATTIQMGTGGDGGGSTTIGHDLVVQGDLTVNGSQTTINSTTLTVDDKNIVIASGAADSSAANGAGITIDGASATLTWDHANTTWDSNQDFNLASGKEYFINDASVLNATTLGSAVVNSSLQTLGTITTGVWNGTIIDPTYGGTGVNNGSKTITLGGSFTHTGAHTLGITTTGNTSVTLPTSGTIARVDDGLNQFAATTSAQLAGVLSDETGTGVAVFGTSPEITTSITTGSTTFGLIDATATTVNFARAATALKMGAATGTTTIQNNLNVDGDIEIDGGDLTFSDASINIANTTPTTVNFADAASTLNIGATTGTMTLKNTNIVITNDLAINGTSLDTDETATFNLLKDNVTTIAFGQAATAIQMGATTGTTTVRNNLTTDGDLTISAGGVLIADAINNIPIGNLTPSSAAFTTLTANNFVTFTDATNATGDFASGSASVKMTGGLHVAKDIKADNFIGDASASDLTSGTIPDARVPSSAITQHQTDITATGILNGGSITSGFGSINIGTSTFSGNGGGLTDLVATQLSSGTIPDARIQSSGVTQHQADLTATGQLNAGSISTGFGNIDIGASSFTGTGACSFGATSFNDNNITNVGSIALDSITSDNGASIDFNSNAVVTFANTSSSTSTTTGAVRVSGGLGVAGALYAASMYTADGSNVQSLNASYLASGTVPNTRIDGTYSNLTGTGALDAGEITANFGNVNIGTSTFTGNGSGLTNVDATTLDSIDSGSFVRSDADDTITGLLTTSRSGEQLKLSDTSATGNPYIGFYQGTTRRAYIQFVDSGGILRLASDENNDRLDIGNGTTGLQHYVDGTGYTVWTSANDGTGSGLDADTLDGVNSGSFLRSDANDSFTGTLSGTGSINISGNVSCTSLSGDGSGITGVTATNAGTLDNLDSSQFLRSDSADQKTSGSLRFNDSIQLNFGTGDDAEIYHNGSDLYFDLNSDDDIYFRDGNSSNATRFTFDISSGNFTASGEITAFSDATLKDNIEIIADPLTKILSVRGVTFTRTDLADTETRHMGVIAQEIEEHFPEVVTTHEESGIKTVNYGAMAGVFIEAIKAQQTQIDDLKRMVKKLTDK